VVIPTPYDYELIALGKALNQTYIQYGKRSTRKARRANIYKQDANSKALSRSSYIERSIVKSKKQYMPATADLISAYVNDHHVISKISQDMLPDELQGKSKKAIRKIIQKKSQERARLQKRIEKLERKRNEFISKQKKSSHTDLGTAIVEAIREQAKMHGFGFQR
jgi:hypothetical protein